MIEDEPRYTNGGFSTLLNRLNELATVYSASQFSKVGNNNTLSINQKHFLTWQRTLKQYGNNTSTISLEQTLHALQGDLLRCDPENSEIRYLRLRPLVNRLRRHKAFISDNSDIAKTCRLEPQNLDDLFEILALLRDSDVALHENVTEKVRRQVEVPFKLTERRTSPAEMAYHFDYRKEQSVQPTLKTHNEGKSRLNPVVAPNNPLGNVSNFLLKNNEVTSKRLDSETQKKHSTLKHGNNVTSHTPSRSMILGHHHHSDSSFVKQKSLLHQRDHTTLRDTTRILDNEIVAETDDNEWKKLKAHDVPSPLHDNDTKVTTKDESSQPTQYTFKRFLEHNPKSYEPKQSLVLETNNNSSTPPGCDNTCSVVCDSGSNSYIKEYDIPRLHNSISKSSTHLNSAVICESIYFRGLPETVLLRDMLNPLQGIDGNYIKYVPSCNAFLIRQDINVSIPVRVLVSRLCALGIHYRRLRAALNNCLTCVETHPASSWNFAPSNKVVDQSTEPIVEFPPSTEPLEDPHYQHDSTSKFGRPKGHVNNKLINCSSDLINLKYDSACTIKKGVIREQCSLIQNALSQFLRNQLTEFYKLLAVIETEILEFDSQNGQRQLEQEPHPHNDHAAFSLRELALWLQDPAERMATLAAVSDVTFQLKGGVLISALYDHAQRGDVAGKKLLRDMVSSVLVPWIEMVNRWTRNAILADPFDEFFVIRNDQRTTHSNTYDDNRVSKETKLFEHHNETPTTLWKSTFAIDFMRLPVFIPKEVALKIFTCGKAVALIKCFWILETTTLMLPSAIDFYPSTHEIHSNNNNYPIHQRQQQNSAFQQDPRSLYSKKNYVEDEHHETPITTQTTSIVSTVTDDDQYACINRNQHQSQQVRPSISHKMNENDFDETLINGGSPTITNARRLSVIQTNLKYLVSPRQHHKKKNTKQYFYSNLISSNHSPDILMTHLPPNCNFEDDDTVNYLQNKVVYEGGDDDFHENIPSFQNKKNSMAWFRDIHDMQQKIYALEHTRSLKVVRLLTGRYHLLSHCEAIRRFLLLGQGDFVTEILAQFSPAAEGLSTGISAQCDLNQPAKKVPVHQLRTGLQLAVSATNAQHFPAEVLHRFDIKKLDMTTEKNETKCLDALTAWDVVCLEYVTDGSPVSLVLNELSMRGYQMLHSLLWRVQSISYKLNRVWINHIRNFRCQHRSSIVYKHQRPRVGVLDFSAVGQVAAVLCEGLYIEMTHFLRNIQSFFMYEVIEPAWIHFVYDVDKIESTPTPELRMSYCDENNINNLDNSQQLKYYSSLVDSLIERHAAYVGTMLHGAFLVDQTPPHSTIEAKKSLMFPFVADETRILSTADHRPINDLKEETANNTSVLLLLLKILDIINGFIEIASVTYLEIYRSRNETNNVTTANLEYCAINIRNFSETYTHLIIEFLKHLNAMAKTTTSSYFISSNTYETNNIRGGTASDGNCTEALRSLLCRLDFNNYYGSHGELYRNSKKNIQVYKDCQNMVEKNKENIPLKIMKENENNSYSEEDSSSNDDDSYSGDEYSNSEEDEEESDNNSNVSDSS